MPVQVEKEPKIYTTVYDNFRGVDYTNDASNVYRRRSPDGVNMLPDMDGRPFKRHGWKIDVPYTDFIPVGSETTEVIPQKTHYFSYGGYGYLMIFNSEGVFYKRDDQDSVTKCWIATGESGGSVTTAKFPPEVVIDDTVDPPETMTLPADTGRSFFFEGNGTAGYYVFCGLELYRFGEGIDGEMYFFKVDPHIPTIITGAVPASGVGAALDSLNMLTDLRTIEYFGDGTALYALGREAVSDSVKVSLLLADGEWHDIPQEGILESGTRKYPWAYSGGAVTFTNQKPSTSTVVNVRITFAGADSTSYSETSQAQSPIVNGTMYMRTYYYRDTTTNDYYEKRGGRWVKTSTSKTTTGWIYYIPKTSSFTKVTHNVAGMPMTFFIKYASFPLSTPNNTGKSGTFKVSYNGHDYITPSGGEILKSQTWGAYNKSVSVNFYDFANRGPSSTYISGSNTTTSTYMINSTHKRVEKKTRETKWETNTKHCSAYMEYTKYNVSLGQSTARKQKEAFTNCQKVLTFGNNIYNQVFISASQNKDFKNRVWYSAVNDPSYFPDTNYIEVGADDRAVMGLLKIGSYLGIVKMGSGTEASVYLAYATSFDEKTTYAVKQSVTGIGAISVGAFNVLNEEPLFLSDGGVVGVNISEDNTQKQIRNRSYWINRKLIEETPDLGSAISFVHKNMYYLATGDGHCFVLDGAQKSSWANEKTNLQYECYYLENLPAQCFAECGGQLYFTDNYGNLCVFSDDYVDEYTLEEPDQTVDVTVTQQTITEDETSYTILYFDPDDLSEDTKEGDIIRNSVSDYTVLEVTDEKVIVGKGVPILARWSTLADDDGAIHFFKNLRKKGNVVSLLPADMSGVTIYVRADEKDRVKIGDASAKEYELPYDVFAKKKVKKYKRLQFICENDKYDSAFGVDQITKCYTMGNYAKNRG